MFLLLVLIPACISSSILTYRLNKQGDSRLLCCLDILKTCHWPLLRELILRYVDKESRALKEERVQGSQGERDKTIF